MKIIVGCGRTEPNGPMEAPWVRFDEGPRIPLAELTAEQLRAVKAAGLLRTPSGRTR